jgi:hypothetical protein
LDVSGIFGKGITRLIQEKKSGLYLYNWPSYLKINQGCIFIIDRVIWDFCFHKSTCNIITSYQIWTWVVFLERVWRGQSKKTNSGLYVYIWPSYLKINQGFIFIIDRVIWDFIFNKSTCNIITFYQIWTWVVFLERVSRGRSKKKSGLYLYNWPSYLKINQGFIFIIDRVIWVFFLQKHLYHNNFLSDLDVSGNFGTGMRRDWLVYLTTTFLHLPFGWLNRVSERWKMMYCAILERTIITELAAAVN